jgi:hypothetical protein
MGQREPHDLPAQIRPARRNLDHGLLVGGDPPPCRRGDVGGACRRHSQNHQQCKQTNA